MTPLRFAVEVESAVNLRDADIEFVGAKRANRLGYQVVVLTCLKNDQVLEYPVDWAVVDQSLYPGTFVALAASEILIGFSLTGKVMA